MQVLSMQLKTKLDQSENRKSKQVYIYKTIAHYFQDIQLHAAFVEREDAGTVFSASSKWVTSAVVLRKRRGKSAVSLLTPPLT